MTHLMENGRAEVQARSDATSILHFGGIKMPLPLQCTRTSENNIPTNKLLAYVCV